MSRADRPALPGIVAISLALAACTSAPASPTPLASTQPAESKGESAPPPDASASVNATPATWQTEADAPFARLEMAVTAHDGRIWLAGGLSPLGEALTDVEIFDPASGEWTGGPSLPASVHHAALVSDGERLLLIGGYLGAAFNRPTDIVLTLADGGDSWQPGPSLPEPRAAGAAAWDGERVVYAGGVGGVGDAIEADVYALTEGTWEPIGAMREAREHLAATSDGEGRTWLMGGRVGGLTSNLGTVELVEGSDIELLGGLSTPRGGVAAVHVPAIGACLTGGEAPDRAFTVVECMGTDGAVTSLPDLTEPHHGHGAAIVDGVVYVLLGGPEPTLSAGSTVESLPLGALAP
jgi:hypothetical protein